MGDYALATLFNLKIAVEIPICIILATKNRRKRRKSQNLRHLSFRRKKRYFTIWVM